jgi:predicted dienelactone hydrolase
MITSKRNLAVGFLTAFVFVAGACSSSSSSTPSAPTNATTGPSTTAATSGAAPYAKKGAFAVGYTALHLAGNRQVVVWYPADPALTAGHQQETIDLASLLSPDLQSKIPASDRVKYQAGAYQDAPAAAQPGNYPLVVFSHGFAGYPEQSVSLTTHLASWGFVVAAPDHVERSLDGLLGTAAKGVPKSTDVAVLQATLALVVKSSNAPGLLHGLVDPNRVVTAGHSAGAGAAYQFASADPRVKAWISYSVGFGGRGGPAPAAPDKPGMVMLGMTDGIIPPASSVKVYDGMHAPKYLVRIPRAGHLVFSDICLIGRSKGGVIGIVKAIHLPIPDELLKLGSDGCTADHPRVEIAFPAIDQLSVGFFRWALHIDPEPVGLDTAAVAGLGGNVTVAHQG